MLEAPINIQEPELNVHKEGRDMSIKKARALAVARVRVDAMLGHFDDIPNTNEDHQSLESVELDAVRAINPSAEFVVDQKLWRTVRRSPRRHSWLLPATREWGEKPNDLQDLNQEDYINIHLLPSINRLLDRLEGVYLNDSNVAIHSANWNWNGSNLALSAILVDGRVQETVTLAHCNIVPLANDQLDDSIPIKYGVTLLDLSTGTRLHTDGDPELQVPGLVCNSKIGFNDRDARDPAVKALEEVVIKLYTSASTLCILTNLDRGIIASRKPPRAGHVDTVRVSLCKDRYAGSEDRSYTWGIIPILLAVTLTALERRKVPRSWKRRLLWSIKAPFCDDHRITSDPKDKK